MQHIVIDGGSTDNSLDILRKNDHLLDFWCHEEDQGQTDAINKGWKHASGNYINWLNADDALLPNALRIVEEAFKKYDAHVVCGKGRLIWPDGHSVIKRSSHSSRNYAKFIAQGHILQPSTFWRKDILDRYFPLPIELNYMMDHFLWLQYISEFGSDKVVYIDDILTEINMHLRAKSVDQLELFDHERLLIYNDLIASYANTNSSIELRRFNASNSKISNLHSDIIFYLGYDRIFKRDPYGRKEGIRLKQLKDSLINYPIRTITEGVTNILHRN